MKIQSKNIKVGDLIKLPTGLCNLEYIEVIKIIKENYLIKIKTKYIELIKKEDELIEIKKIINLIPIKNTRNGYNIDFDYVQVTESDISIEEKIKFGLPAKFKGFKIYFNRDNFNVNEFNISKAIQIFKIHNSTFYQNTAANNFFVI